MSSDNKANDGKKQQTEDDFETVNHEDAETPGNTERKSPTTTKDDLSLTRFDNRNQEEEDDSDDEPAMAHHPIFGMLAGRLGQRRRGSTHKYDKLHPENQVLSLAHLEDCIEVENSAFPENERASREKPTKAEVENGATQKRKLVAHIIATRTAAPCVTDASMDYPKDWRTNKTTLPRQGETETLGHQEVGGTVCIHSIAVRPDYQSMGIGSVLLRSYLQRIKDAKIADRLALLAHDDMKRFYGRFGFDDMGPSQATFGGGNWNNMILEFSDLQDD
ncbi:hypothetical protein LTR70_004426 [Exophiala xenobiotica]|uniref:N-acetyltransferase domain-containing protein n=1 Tax=Lithohypha guttulata TaxID=1690604 RepID=A0ABR0KDF7_9EURO|nr:hypothetical protein LTR24_003905 [Lithohypha guttulata]KAK5320848.1 hypothetical protein LTR70_004426 [Exophiala xenobiotica]